MIPASGSSTVTYAVSGGVGGTDQVQVVMTVIPADSGRSRVSAGKLSDGQSYGVVETVAGQVKARGRNGFFTRSVSHGTIDAVLDDGTHISGDWRCSSS